MRSPFCITRPIKNRLRSSGLSIFILIPSRAGAIVTFCAGIASIFAIITNSPIRAPALRRVRPSIRTILSPISPGRLRSTFATEVRSPIIETKSPGFIFSSSM